MGTGGSTQGVGHLDRAGNTSAETDAVIGAGHVVAHGLRNGHDAHAFLIEAHAIAEGIVAADGDEVFHAQPGEILQDFGRKVVPLGVVFALQVVRDTVFGDAARIGARRVQEGAAGAPGAIHDVLGKALKVVGVVVLFVANEIDKPGPASPDTNHFIAFTERTKRDGTDRRVQAGNVSAAGEDTNNALLYINVRHGTRIAPEWSRKQTIIYPKGRLRNRRYGFKRVRCRIKTTHQVLR